MTVGDGAVRVCAPAKINVILRVLDRRPDGYHNLWSVMQTVALEDELRLRVRAGQAGVMLQCDDPTLPTDHRNLVSRAATLALERAGLNVGLEIELMKRIPHGAGLGGGSSDAAATIQGMNRLLGLGWTVARMAELGQQVGSDVPFFFFAPSALVTGRGEIVKPLRLKGARWVVLVNPGFPIDTRWAYERLSATRSGARSLSSALRAVETWEAVTWEELLPLVENDFEAAVFPEHGVLHTIKTRLLSQGAEAALLSGSGSTVFGVFRDETAARQAHAGLDRFERCRAYVVRTCTEALSCEDPSASAPLPVG
ncbi:MAG TPA: 4-(cytidine 5'-diphospho)-2-C-methyl-D-erythritol kinase [Nitrospiraceae bacterium]|jgi:4-diphosphocytidyl-2-C-methyl-D-erythritol kinase|nr:4-(cytidine 5'-diphospho)-2-C-methyl-D-erythritol kinase [Nitrospiraceae bacterium]